MEVKRSFQCLPIRSSLYVDLGVVRLGGGVIDFKEFSRPPLVLKYNEWRRTLVRSQGAKGPDSRADLNATSDPLFWREGLRRDVRRDGRVRRRLGWNLRGLRRSHRVGSRGALEVRGGGEEGLYPHPKININSSVLTLEIGRSFAPMN